MQELPALGDASHVVDFLNLWRQEPATTTLAGEGHGAPVQMMREHPEWSEPSLRDVALLLQMRPWFRETQQQKDLKRIDLRLKHLDKSAASEDDQPKNQDERNGCESNIRVGRMRG